MTGEYRLYRDLAGWWPLISPPDQYSGEAAALAEVLGSAPAGVREVLDLGSGGGHIAAHLKGRLVLTLVDQSADMLAVSRQLNPDCAHVLGDMRTIRLGRGFDAVLVHDAVDYMITEADLRQVVETAFAHCREGGIAVFVPDYTAETFRAGTGSGGSRDDAAGRRASFTERLWDPDPADTWVQADYEFTLRSADGTSQVVTETHRLGSFGRDTWLALLAGAGFEHAPPPGRAGHASRLRNLFVGRRPAGITSPARPARCWPPGPAAR